MDNNSLILIPEGEYELTYECHETNYFISGSAKVSVWFQIIDQSEHYGTLLPRHYNAQKLIDGPAVGGAFTVGMGSDCAHEFAWIADKQINPDCVTLIEFKHKVILGEVTTVKKTRNKKERHPCMQYSKIGSLLRITPG